MSTPYIPPSDAGFSGWLLNFSTLISATPTAYGLTVANATTIGAQNTAYQQAYLTAIDPSTRTPAAVANKDAIKALALATVRPFAMQINASAGISDLQRSELGLTIRKTVPTPVPSPTATPGLALINLVPGIVNVRTFDTAAPTSKAKPYGSSAVEIFASVGTVFATDPSQASYHNGYSKSPVALQFGPGDVGKKLSIFARYATKGSYAGASLKGPWSAPLNVTIA